ncbi:phage holin, LLH family [Limosilactobacillus agrestis]|uniref:phage holin, LLH family n=1 Tax=Limosilactobacillus agrestis TaxID=2759748 RepID=UPI001E41BAFF|nr:phage holin, LLH family [Limosilactobacillus agrestis]MCD7127357.1 phage holin family protein [Limosilactobacillus agrestis]
MKTLNDIINWIINSGFLALLIYIAVAFGKPFVDSKIKHAKTAQQKELWTLLQQVSMTVVNSLVGKDMTGQAKFAEAVTQVQAYLENKGLNVDMKQVQSAVQSAYELSTLTPIVDPTSQQAQSTKTATIAAGQAPAIDPMKGEE